jgi:SAM-dependent methyltransferase
MVHFIGTLVKRASNSVDPPSGEQRRDREVAFFDRFVTEQGDYDVLSDAAYRRLLLYFERLVRPRTGERCIDLGCGTGTFTRRLRGYGLRLEGMDISPASVEVANRAADGERYRCGDINRTELADGSYDIILYSGVLHHFANPALRAQVLREGHRLLAPGGRLFAYDPSAHSPSMFLYRDPRSPLFSREGKTENEVLLRRADLEKELRDVGFDSIAIHGASGITFKYVEGRLARRLLWFYNLYEEFVRLSPIEHWIGTFLVSFAQKPPA